MLGTPSVGPEEKISKVSGEEGPVVDRRKAERALHQLQAELLQHDQRRDEDEVKLADAVRQVSQLNQQLDALTQDLERMKTFSREQQSQIEGGLTLRVIHDAAAPFRYRLHEVAGADSEERTENESFITLVDEQDVPLAHATVDSANESLPGEAKRGTVKLTWATESARKLFEAPIQSFYNLRERQRVMYDYHLSHNHLSVERLNQHFAAGKIPGGMRIKKLPCPVCHPPLPGLRHGTASRGVVPVPWHTWHADPPGNA